MRNTHWYTKEKPLIYTNLFFIIPFIIAVAQDKNYFALLLILIFILSTTHHLFKTPGSEWWWHTKGRQRSQTFLLISEILLSFILAFWSIILLLDSSKVLLTVALIVFIPSFVLYLNTDYKKYVFYHALWHIAVALVISLALL